MIAYTAQDITLHKELIKTKFHLKMDLAGNLSKNFNANVSTCVIEAINMIHVSNAFSAIYINLIYALSEL